MIQTVADSFFNTGLPSPGVGRPYRHPRAVDAVSRRVACVDNDIATRDWLEANKPALEATATIDLISDGSQEPAHHKSNLEILLTFKTEYEQRIEAQFAEAANAEYQEDPGLRILEERGSKYIQTDSIDSILFLNGNIVGEPQ